jgi:EAL domain-containing protein (putative c-di-GMP-specific phosphodiesterase class I)
MAHSLDLKVVAEGVEDCQQLEFLRAQGCDEVQGYLISRPVEADVLGGILRSRLAEAWSPVRKALHCKAT